MPLVRTQMELVNKQHTLKAIDQPTNKFLYKTRCAAHQTACQHGPVDVMISRIDIS